MQRDKLEILWKGNKMIDIHSHIIYDVDDGPKTLDESLELIEKSYTQGVRKIVSTSHRRKGMFETPEFKILQNFNNLKEAVKKKYPDLELYYGAEIYFTEDVLKKLSDGIIPTMNSTRFILLEFSMTTPWREIHSAISKILTLGITPIIAHIERYNALEKNKKRVQELINMGCYTQINSVHVLKPSLFFDKEKILKKRAQFFLKEYLVHCISSDMHNTNSRPPYMDEAFKIVEKKYGLKHANLLFKDNAAKLLENQYI